jgi:2-oxoglutarate dehydrogenase E1 component
MIEAPIFHVNGDDPEAVVYAAKVATEFRMKFHKPVVIDMFCYRRFGHNEGDEPAFTQPLMYKQDPRPQDDAADLRQPSSIAEGVISEAKLDQMKADWRAQLEVGVRGRPVLQAEQGRLARRRAGPACDPRRRQDELRRGKTGRAGEDAEGDRQEADRNPEGLRGPQDDPALPGCNRRKMIDTGEGIDWSTAEALAFGAILLDGNPIRLSGQDSERGTFSQRHSVLYDQRDENRYIPLNNLGPQQANYEVINSMLSEEAVLGFEYGYSLAEPKALTLWEAQFGDFANGAQVVFDQFISSGERKWLRMSGLVCLLPHGYEGQGPEHSSARLERFLQLCAPKTTCRSPTARRRPTISTSCAGS